MLHLPKKTEVSFFTLFFSSLFAPVYWVVCVKNVRRWWRSSCYISIFPFHDFKERIKEMVIVGWLACQVCHEIRVLGTCLEHNFIMFLSDGIALCIHSLILGYCRFFVHSALAFFWCRISVHMVIFGDVCCSFPLTGGFSCCFWNDHEHLY